MSIRLHLALCYAGLAGLVVLVVAGLAYAIHSRALYDQVDLLLESAVTHAITEYVKAQTPAERTAVLAAPLPPEIALHVTDARGHMLAMSPNAAAVPAVDPEVVLGQAPTRPFDVVVGLAPPFVPVRDQGGHFGIITGVDGTRWRVYLEPIGESGQFLEASSSLAQVDASVERFRQLVPALSVLGGIITLLAGWFLASRALRPVAVLTETADLIASSHDFKRRVPVPAHRDELSQLAMTFNRMLESLGTAYQAQQRFVADASHELRAPLTAIQANLELLTHQPNLTPTERQEAADEANQEAQRLARLVADLLALARADAGVPLRRQTVELDRVVLDVLAEAHRLQKGQRLEVTAIEPISIVGDPDRLKQLVVILVDNALRYTPPGGEVSLGLRRASRHVELTVRDTGVGIAPDDLPHVFERFYRADRSRARDPGGTGLGLPIARWIAEQHGGDVTLASELGKGTVATVCFPLPT